MGQVGIPLFYLQGMGGGAVLKFRDLFNDSSQFWAWLLFKGELSEVGKTGTEINGQYQLAILPDTNGEWNSDNNEAPRLIINPLSIPCEIITRLDSFVNTIDGHAGLFVAKDPTCFGSTNFIAICRKQTGTHNGIAVVDNNTSMLAGVLITTLPMWFRIRLGCNARFSLNAYFDYSLDGLNWTNLWIHNTGVITFSTSSSAVGLFVSNFASHNETVGGFDHFIMRPRSIN